MEMHVRMTADEEEREHEPADRTPGRTDPYPRGQRAHEQRPAGLPALCGEAARVRQFCRSSACSAGISWAAMVLSLARSIACNAADAKPEPACGGRVVPWARYGGL